MREHLEAEVYGYDDDIQSNALEAHVSRLRRRLQEADAGVILHAVRGVGYMLGAAS
jgi:DNA-binding response OmpR family regulator